MCGFMIVNLSSLSPFHELKEGEMILGCVVCEKYISVCPLVCASVCVYLSVHVSLTV